MCDSVSRFRTDTFKNKPYKVFLREDIDINTPDLRSINDDSTELKKWADKYLTSFSDIDVCIVTGGDRYQ